MASGGKVNEKLVICSHSAYYHKRGPYKMLLVALKMVPDICNYT
jgi:hypothetical protein